MVSAVHAISNHRVQKSVFVPQVLADYKRVAAGLVGTRTVPLQYRCWVDLLRNQVMIPQASFTGHVCGILAGLVHVFLPKAGDKPEQLNSYFRRASALGKDVCRLDNSPHL